MERIYREISLDGKSEFHEAIGNLLLDIKELASLNLEQLEHSRELNLSDLLRIKRAIDTILSFYGEDESKTSRLET